jgi:glycyl-tRNA synthetase alpha subunit
MIPEVESVMRHTDAGRIGQQPRRLQHVLQIQQRLAHPHHHDVEAGVGLQ